MATEKTKKTHKKREGDRDTSWHDRFIELLAQTCNVTLAAKGAGVSRSAAYVHRSLFGDFAAQWDSAEQEAIEVLEAEAWRRARRTSDTLLIFLLKAHKPDKYRENVQQQHTGGVEVVVKHVQTTKTN